MTHDDIEPTLAELAALPDGWNSYDAHRVTPWAIDTARTVLTRLADQFPAVMETAWIVPTPRGGFNLDLSGTGRELEIEWCPGDPPSVVVLKDARATRYQHEEERAADGFDIAPYMEWLLGAKV